MIVAYIFGFAAFYNSTSNKAHLREFFGLYSLGVLLVSLFIAFLLTSKREAWPVGLRVGVLVVFAVVTCGGFMGYVAMNPAATHYKRTMLGVDYAVPHRHTSNRETSETKTEFLYTSICLSTQTPYRGPECEKAEGLSSYSSAKLSSNYITDGFWVTDVLNGVGVSYEGDVLGAIPEGASSIVDGVTVIPHENARLMLEMDNDRRVMRAVWCRTNRLECTAFVQTEYGVLQFPTVGPAKVDKERWAKDQAAYEAVFNAWVCEEPTCGGLFLNGATVAYE